MFCFLPFVIILHKAYMYPFLIQNITVQNCLPVANVHRICDLNPWTNGIWIGFNIAAGHRLNVFLMDSVYQTIKLLQSPLYLMLSYQKESGNGMMTPRVYTWDFQTCIWGHGSMILVQENWSGKYAHINLQAFQWNEQYCRNRNCRKRTELNKIVSINQHCFTLPVLM